MAAHPPRLATFADAWDTRCSFLFRYVPFPQLLFDPVEQWKTEEHAREVCRGILELTFAIDDRQVLHDLREGREHRPGQENPEVHRLAGWPRPQPEHGEDGEYSRMNKLVQMEIVNQRFLPLVHGK